MPTTSTPVVEIAFSPNERALIADLLNQFVQQLERPRYQIKPRAVRRQYIDLLLKVHAYKSEWEQNLDRQGISLLRDDLEQTDE